MSRFQERPYLVKEHKGAGGDAHFGQDGLDVEHEPARPGDDHLLCSSNRKKKRTLFVSPQGRTKHRGGTNNVASRGHEEKGKVNMAMTLHQIRGSSMAPLLRAGRCLSTMSIERLRV